jgi:hypothetical protein
MRIVVRIKHEDKLLHEWIGEVAEPSGFAQSVLEALDEFRALMPDFPIWGLTIRIDKYGDGRLS